MANRSNFNTTLDDELMEKVKLIAVKTNQNYNDVMEEGLKLVIEKYQEELDEL